MAGSAVVEFALFALAADVGAGATVFHERQVAASKTAGLLQQYAGTKLEDPGTGVHITLWNSAAALGAFREARSQSGGGGSGLDKPFLVEVFSVSSLDGGGENGLAAALAAPCTEICTGYGAEPGVFAAATRTFRDRLDAGAVVGCLGSAVLESAEDVEGPAGGGGSAAAAAKAWETAGPAVKLLIGWTSRDAHLEAKGKPGPIAENIGLLRTARKAIDLYHVQLNKS